MLGWSVDEAFGISLVETGQHPLAVCNDLVCSTIVHILRSEQDESRMMMAGISLELVGPEGLEPPTKAL